MSSKGLFTAVSGAVAQQQRLDTIANNIANSNTAAFKKDRQTFSEYLTAYEKMDNVIQVPRVPASIESFYEMNGGDKSYANAAGTFTDFTQGQLKPTGSTLDVGLEGRGFFEVLTPQGVRLTRGGAFHVNSAGQLVTKEGHLVLKDGLGQDAQGRGITLSGRNVTISYQGDIYDGGDFVGKLSLVNVNNADAIQKVGSSLYALKPNYNEALVAARDLQTHQGFIETSNVNIIEEMTDMIAASRTFESTQQALKAFDQMDDKLVNQVPKL